MSKVIYPLKDADRSDQAVKGQLYKLRSRPDDNRGCGLWMS